MLTIEGPACLSASGKGLKTTEIEAGRDVLQRRIG